MDDINILSVNGKDPEDMPWAREMTLQAIAKDISKMAKTSQRDSSSMLDSILEGNEEGEAQRERLNRETKSGNDDARQDSRIRNKLQQSTVDKLEHMGVKFDGMGDNLLGGMGGGVMGVVANAVGVAFDTVIESMVAGVSSFADAYKDGLAVGEDAYEGFVNSTIGLQISMSSLSEISQEYTNMMNQVGIPTFLSFNDAMRKGEENSVSFMSKFGLTNREAADYMASYLDQHRLLTGMENLESMRNMKKMKESYANTDRFAKALGVSTEHLMNQLKAQAEDVNVRKAMLNVDKDSKESMNKLLAIVPDSMKNMVLDMLQNPALAEGTNSFKDLLKGGASGVAYALKDIVMAANDGSLAMGDIEGIMQNLNGEFKKVDLDSLNAAGTAGHSFADTTKIATVEFKERMDNINATLKAGTNIYAESSVTLGNFIETTEGAIQKLFADLATPEMLEMFTYALGLATEMFTDTMKSFATIDQKDIKEFFNTTLPGFFVTVKEMMVGISEGWMNFKSSWLGESMGFGGTVTKEEKAELVAQKENLNHTKNIFNAQQTVLKQIEAGPAEKAKAAAENEQKIKAQQEKVNQENRGLTPEQDKASFTASEKQLEVLMAIKNTLELQEKILKKTRTDAKSKSITGGK